MNQAVLIPERIVSLKIFAHKLRKYAPLFYKFIFLELRHLFFKKYCNASNLNVVYSDGSWLNRKSTSDSLAIENYLVNNIDLVRERSILHVGIGNGELTQFLLFSKPSSLHGLTIIEEEHTNASSFSRKHTIKECKYFLQNKYSLNAENNEKKYNIIIDNDLAGYACCKTHFRSLIKYYYKSLSSGGLLITGERGLLYFDNGFGINQRLQDHYLKSYFTHIKTTSLGCVIFRKNGV